MTAPDWTAVYEQHFPHVYRALVATLFDREAALDALQDAFEEGIRKPPPDQRNLPGWLYRVALRKARKGLMRLPITLGRPPDRAVGDEVDALLQRLDIGRLLQTLTERQRSILVAHYYLGLSQEEIGDLLGIRRGTVSATISQALARLRGGELHA